MSERANGERPLSAGFVLTVVDVAASARMTFGDAYREMFPDSPERDIRFEMMTPSGDLVTFHGDATAEHVAEYISREITPQ